MTKPFSQELHATNDPAKHVVIDWLTNRGWSVGVNPDTYGIDLLGTRHGETWGIEVEVKHNWASGDFPYETVHFAARKRKFAQPNTLFVMLRADWQEALVFKGEDLANSPTVIKSTVYTRQEEFIAVPLSACWTVWL